jgi:hypothetical protein
MTNTMTSEIPDVLGERGSALWDALQSGFEFDVHETALLLESCRTLDVIDSLADAIDVGGVVILGSTGQSVVHPAVAEMRQQQQSFSRLITMLNLADSDIGSVVTPRSTAARNAAQKRWRDKKAAKGA